MKKIPEGQTLSLPSGIYYFAFFSHEASVEVIKNGQQIEIRTDLEELQLIRRRTWLPSSCPARIRIP